MLAREQMPPASPASFLPSVRLRAVIRGGVQGVGFRPFVHRLAVELGLPGWVINDLQGVTLEVEGSPDRVEAFLERLLRDKPAPAWIASLEPLWLSPIGLEGFEIRESAGGGARTAMVMPDIATCTECVAEIFDPGNRRFRYPFTNCTRCGPRFSILRALPYDRANTSMAQFTLCGQCLAEYQDPLNRRFHAEPTACPECGPRLALWGADGTPQALAIGVAGPNGGNRAALEAAARTVRAGRILALKGIGGFQLIADARNPEAIERLRQRKHREEKPFAVMFPTLAEAAAACEIGPLEARLLGGPESPIVLLRRKPQPEAVGRIAERVAPDNPFLGVLLPYSPIHYLLMEAVGGPVIATSGNLADEPICTDDREAVERLGGIADQFLVHDRPIVRHVDDSIAQVVLHREMVLRRARGYAPLPVRHGQPPLAAGAGVLGVGAHLKNTVAFAMGSEVFLSQHIGDLETVRSMQAFHGVIEDFQAFYGARPATVAADLHPDYLSTQFAWERSREAGGPVRFVPVQHHVAHVLACMAENELTGPALGVSWDGTGLGTDGTIWGGEFFRIDGVQGARVAHLRSFRLPGVDRAMREARRCALGALFEVRGVTVFDALPSGLQSAFTIREREQLKAMLVRDFRCPLTTSAGRLFDAVASLLDLRQVSAFEGQAAMAVEFAAAGCETAEAYEVAVSSDGTPGVMVLDWSRLLEAMLRDADAGDPVARICRRFHNGLAEGIVEVARRVNLSDVVISGGCFQNRLLLSQTVARLSGAGFRVSWPQRVPPNDGGISLGQVVAALGESV
jgi:hydrogenase maturation protein HypF